MEIPNPLPDRFPTWDYFRTGDYLEFTAFVVRLGVSKMGVDRMYMQIALHAARCPASRDDKLERLDLLLGALPDNIRDGLHPAELRDYVSTMSRMLPRGVPEG